jgi:hypothetical protein
MFSKQTWINIALVLVIVLAGCVSALYVPTGKNVSDQASLAELEKGRQLYIGKCGGCHSLFLPEKYNKEQWRHWVQSMEVKADINKEEGELIYKYLTGKQRTSSNTH